MAVRTEDVLGEVTAIGTTYTIVGAAVAAATTWNLQVHLVNRTASAIKVRVYRADNSWTTGEPTGGTLKTSWGYDLNLGAGGAIDLTGRILKTTEKLVVRSDTASSLDVQADGIKVT